MHPSVIRKLIIELGQFYPMNKLSVFLIVYNEEKNIGRCLERLKWADEIVIVDSFSKDKTLEIARKYTKKIYQKEFSGFGELKNFALGKTGNNWVLNIDADEIVTEQLEGEIKKVLESPEHDGYYIPRRSFIGKRWLRHAGQYPCYQLRLFRKDRGRFEDAKLHERVKCTGNVGHLKSDLVHYNFADWTDVIAKLNRRTSIEAAELLRKRFVWFYPWKTIRMFFAEYGSLRRSGNDRRTSFVIARNVFSKYEIKWIAPIRFIGTFIRLYIIQQGFRDGLYGLFWSVTVSYHMILRYIKYYELKKNLA